MPIAVGMNRAYDVPDKDAYGLQRSPRQTLDFLHI